MKKLKIGLIILSLICCFNTKVKCFDPQAVSQVSKAIAQWKLMKQDKHEAEPIYISSSLSQIVKNKDNKILPISGLIISGNYQIELQKVSDKYIFHLPVSNSYDFAISQINSFGQNRIINQMMVSYEKFGQICNDVVNLSRIYKQLPPSNIVLQNTALGTRILNITITTAGTVTQAADVFLKTADYIGRSMQLMNPPLYLNEKTPWGAIGHGSYPIPNGYTFYFEILDTSRSISRVHTSWTITKTGSYYRYVNTNTSTSSALERFMMHHYPVGTYFDPEKTTITSIVKIYQHHYVKTLPGGSVYLNGKLVTKGIPNIFSIPTYSTPKIQKISTPSSTPYFRWR